MLTSNHNRLFPVLCSYLFSLWGFKKSFRIQSTPNNFIHQNIAMFWEAFIKLGYSFATAVIDPTTLITLQRSKAPFWGVHYHSTHSLTHTKSGYPQHLFYLRSSCRHPLYWPFIAAIKPKRESVLLNKCLFHPPVVVDEQQNFFTSRERISSHVSCKPLAQL